MYSLQLYLDILKHNTTQSFNLGSPVSVSRTIMFGNHSNAFNLPHVSSHPFSYKDIFIGDVLQGGSCIVDILSFCPHNLTHVETSDHILNQVPGNASISKIPLQHLQGLVYVIDLSNKLNVDTKLIQPEHIEDELLKITIPVTAIALKTQVSELPQDYDFTGKDCLALSKDTSEKLANFSIDDQKITTLLLDLPSTDAEDDGGKLLAHRAFFEITHQCIEIKYSKKKIIVELANFQRIVQNYYYFILTPARITSNAMITDIFFYPLITK